MTARNVPILAAVSGNERPIIEAAALQLSQALSEAAGESWTSPCTFVPNLSSLDDTPGGSVIVTSLLVPLAGMDRPWPEVERELREVYAPLCATGEQVMICTILRHVEGSDDPETASRIRRRVRQLNLLAIELSREYGALVIDLDRVLADTGARNLQTDYRLAGAKAVEFASQAIAQCIATNALDAYAPVSVQDGARAIIERKRPVAGPASPIQLANVMALGQGRRKQRVSTVTDEVQENHVGWLVRQVLNGRIGPAEAMDRLLQALRRRGLRESASLLISGMARLFRPQT